MMTGGPEDILFPLEMGGPMHGNDIYFIDVHRWARGDIITNGDEWAHLGNM
jgi:hypothetical protein